VTANTALVRAGSTYGRTDPFFDIITDHVYQAIRQLGKYDGDSGEAEAVRACDVKDVRRRRLDVVELARDADCRLQRAVGEDVVRTCLDFQDAHVKRHAVLPVQQEVHDALAP
jgi:hypothetical protein